MINSIIVIGIRWLRTQIVICSLQCRRPIGHVLAPMIIRLALQNWHKHDRGWRRNIRQGGNYHVRSLVKYKMKKVKMTIKKRLPKNLETRAYYQLTLHNWILISETNVAVNFPNHHHLPPPTTNNWFQTNCTPRFKRTKNEFTVAASLR